MSAVTLICSCGRRLKTTGMTPGKRGRCPVCGSLIRVPDAPTPTVAAEEDEWNWRGEYELGEVAPALGDPPAGTADRGGEDPFEDVMRPQPGPPVTSMEDDEWSWRGPGYGLGAEEPAPPAPEPRVEERPAESAVKRVAEVPAPRPGSWWPPNVLYPLRGAEGIAMVAAFGVVLWVMGTLVPEYCRALMADGEKLGAPAMGRLVSLVTALPVLLLLPPVVIYGLQYLARVLVASAEGEARPPRPPDRNFDGLLDGLGRWLIWAFLGAGVALLPLAAYGSGMMGGAPWNPKAAAVLAALGLPYALMALMLTFLHDDTLAANPVAVLANLGRLGLPFLAVSLTVAATLGLVGASFAAVSSLRERQFYAYVVGCLACWMLAAWASIVAMRTVGAYYYPRRGRLGWRRERPRWGASR